MRKIYFLFLLSIYSTAVKGSEKLQCETATSRTRNPATAVCVSVLDAAVVSGAGVLRERKRRYLIFEKGASVVGNIAKSIITTSPRGLNWIGEYSLAYDLPYSLDFFKPTYLYARKTTNAPTTTTTTTTTTMEPPHWQHSWQDPWQYQQVWQKPTVVQQKQSWQKKHFSLKPNEVRNQRRKMLWCPRENGYKKFDNWNYAKIMRWCASRREMSTKWPRRRYRTVGDPAAVRNGSELMFFDLVGKWAEMHDYNARHCIMRALCESPHWLLPPGHSLLHDMLRILQSFALPHAAAVYAVAADAGHANLNECARLYGPHCRVSFLQHFTTAVHGKFM